MWWSTMDYDRMGTLGVLVAAPGMRRVGIWTLYDITVAGQLAIINFDLFHAISCQMQ